MSRKTFSSILEKFCIKTSILGLKYFYLYPDRISRIFWTINLFAILSFACMLAFLLWLRFRDMPTRITIESQFSSVLELPYPAMALCTPSQMTLPNALHFQKTLVDGNLTIDFTEKLPQLMGFYEPISGVSEEVMAQLQELVDLNRHNVRDVMANLPQSCEEFLVHCIFEMKVIDCKKIFKPILTANGFCCIFNSPYEVDRRQYFLNPTFEPIKPVYPGVYGGLTVLTDYKPQDALNGTLINSGAILVMINDWTEFPSDDQSMLVYPHVESWHKITGVETYCSEDVMALNIESRKCVFSDEYRLKYFRRYRNSDCDLECFIHVVWRRCHCVMYFMPYVRALNICNFKNIPCIMEIRTSMTEADDVEDCECPRDCDSRQYFVHMTTLNFQAQQFLALEHFYDGVTITNTSSLLHLHFANHLYVKQKQETVMSLINLASNLGGVFGMCLGCSVMSVLEVLFFIYKSIKNKMQVSKEMNQKRAVAP